MTSQEAYTMLLEEARATDMLHAKYFAASICGLIAIFTIVNWTQILFNKYSARSTVLARAGAFVSRPICRFLKGSTTWGIAIRPGRWILALVYFGINATLIFTNIDISDMSICARRCGWIALCNICLAVFLGLKNTPLSPLAGRSYESINVLHRCCGYTTMVLMLLHAIKFIVYLVKEKLTMYLMTQGQYAAFVVALSLLSIGVIGIKFMRKRQYELFYAIHVTLVVVILASLIVHLKQINMSAIAVVIVAASMWFLDRSLRLSRWIFHGYGNYCTLTPLPEGATRVVLTRPIKAQPGSHAFLWIPSVRKFQTHPFTLVSNNPAEFIVSARDGFTKALYEAALEAPKTLRRAAVEGPYGNVPSVRNFDKVILIAGGTGITCTMALAMDWVRKYKYARDTPPLDFIWAVKTKEYLNWFDTELEQLQKSASVNLRIHATSDKASKSDISLPLTIASSSDSGEQEKALYADTMTLRYPEKGSLLRSVEFGRPDIALLVRNAVDSVSRNERVLIAASGPTSLLDSVRLAATDCMNSDSPGVHLHLEQFGW